MIEKESGMKRKNDRDWEGGRERKGGEREDVP